ncbi:MAG: hypothetical protein WC683_10250 [bacterium]
MNSEQLDIVLSTLTVLADAARAAQAELETHAQVCDFRAALSGMDWLTFVGMMAAVEQVQTRARHFETVLRREGGVRDGYGGRDSAVD